MPTPSGSFVETGLQQINVRRSGHSSASVEDIEQTAIATKTGTVLRVKGYRHRNPRPVAFVSDKSGRGIHRADGSIVDNDDVVEGSVLLRKGANADETLVAIHDKVNQLNDQILPPGVKTRPVPRPQQSRCISPPTPSSKISTEGVLLVSIILFFFLGNSGDAFIVALTIPFSLLFASICLDLNKIPANLLSIGALDFGMVVDGTVSHIIENIVRHFQPLASSAQDNLPSKSFATRWLEVLRPVFYARAIIITAYLPIFHSAKRRRPPVQALHGLDRLLRPARRCWIFATAIAPVCLP